MRELQRMDRDPPPGIRRYRVLLLLVPPEFRGRWGRDMEELFLLRRAEAGSSLPRVAWVWGRSLLDLLGHAVRERVWARFHWGGPGAGRGAGRRGMRENPRGKEMFVQDLRNAARGLRRAPLFTLAASVTLALGIGSAVATFSVVHAVLIRPLPYENPEELVAVWPEVNANKAMARLAQEEMPSLDAVSGISRWQITLTGAGDPQELNATLVSVGHFDLLGVHPILGRGFREGEDLPGAAGVAVLSYDLWTRAFGADPGIVGRTVDLSGAEYDRRTVIGVMPQGFRPVMGPTDVWVPLEGDPAESVEADDSWYVNWRIARLAPGASLARAAGELAQHALRLHERIPSIIEREEAETATIQPLRRDLVGQTGEVLWAALGAVGLVLLIACANAANLLLARGEARAHDLSIRFALGAGGGRVARLLFLESALLGVVGGTAGIGLAYALVGLIVRQAPPDFPFIGQVGVSGPVLGFALVATVGATILAGMIPAVRARKVDGTAALGGAARGVGRRGAGPLSRGLVTAQVGLAVVVAVGAGLMLRSLGALLSEDPGLDGSQVLVLHPNPLGSRYPDGEAFRDYYTRVMERVAAVPGVTGVGAIHILPGTGWNWSFPTFPEGVDVPEGSPTPTVNFRAVSGDYFQVTRIPLLAGRYPSDTDQGEGESVVVVNQAFVDRFWPGEESLGKEIRIFSRESTPSRVVGVVGDVRQHYRAQEPRAEMYYPHAQVPWNQMSMWVFARVERGEPLDYAEEVRQAVWEIDHDVPISGMDDLMNVMGRSTRTTRFLTILLSGFGLVALFLGGVGVFGVTTYTVGRRIPEFGVRMALGSSKRGILGTALRRSMVPAFLGLIGGLGVAALSAGVLDSALYEVESLDPATYVAVALTLALVALGAMALPAWRASRVDPVRVLNAE